MDRVTTEPDQKDRQSGVEIGGRGRTPITAWQVTEQGVERLPLPTRVTLAALAGSVGFIACIGIDCGGPAEDMQHR